MKIEETLILGREDMIELSINKDIETIDFNDFKISSKQFQTQSIILFIDNNGQTKIMKNRYGDQCEWMINNIKTANFY